MSGEWMTITEVAAELGLSWNAASQRVRAGLVPGGERMYRHEGRKGERWRVSRAAFRHWREANRANCAN